MPLYRVRLVGRNIARAVEGRRELMSFVTTRVVDSGSPENAAELALELVHTMDELREPLNGPDDPFPVVLVDEVEELRRFD